jgi:RimJ/RimL family protein N-acetyltransferase
LAIIDVARRTGRFTHLEIRCDARNAPSAAVPKRLGFELATTIVEPTASPQDPDVQLQIWTLDAR